MHVDIIAVTRQDPRFVAASVDGEFDHDTDYTKKQPIALDETGGIEVIDAVLRESSGTFEVVRPRRRPSLRGALRKLRSWAVRTLQAVRDAAHWLTDPIRNCEVLRWSRAARYQGRHNQPRTWYGVQRSTMNRVAVQRRNAARQPTDSEPALPEHWVSHMENLITRMRADYQVIHPERSHRFICS
jgi:hypothetical protein